MTTLVDHQINQWAYLGGLTPYRPELVNPASVNLRLGNKIKVETIDGSFLDLDISQTTEEEPFMVKPGTFFLAETAEVVRLSDTLEAEVCLRSSAARAGWDHLLAGYVDPGWGGVLTLEFKNCRQYKALPIWAGMQLVQLRLSRLQVPPTSDYSLTGRYYGDKGVQGCKDLSIDK